MLMAAINPAQTAHANGVPMRAPTNASSNWLPEVMKRPYSRRKPTSMVRRQSAEQGLEIDIGLLGQRKFQ
jgi:hypothetical protein